MDKEKFYLALPVPVQHVACSLQGSLIKRLRFGPGFLRRLEEIEGRSLWSADRIMEYRDRRLCEFLRYSQKQVYYYRKLFHDCGVDARDIQSLTDLGALPVLEKSAVQDRCLEFHPEELPKRSFAIHTSGTTGAGLRFYSTLEAQQEQWAVWWRYRRWHGIKPGTWCGYFGGRSIVPMSQKNSPFWRYNIPMRQVMFSAYHLSPENVSAYIGELRRRKPPWLHGYPSLLALLASWLLDRGESLDYTPRWITTGAENLLAQQATIIHRAFGTRPRQHYGMAEGVANISECEQGSLHVDEDFAAIEFLPVASDRFKVVGTNFTNPATPLVRYATDDIVCLGRSVCACGRPGRLVENIDGRNEDYVLLSNGAHVGRMDHILKDLTNIREAQIVQFRPGEVIFRVVCGPGYGSADEQLLRREASKRVGQCTIVKVEYVSTIERSRTGKLRFVISHCASGKTHNPLALAGTREHQASSAAFNQ